MDDTKYVKSAMGNGEIKFYIFSVLSLTVARVTMLMKVHGMKRPSYKKCLLYR